jgi:hypothetical protein
MSRGRRGTKGIQITSKSRWRSYLGGRSMAIDLPEKVTKDLQMASMQAQAT